MELKTATTTSSDDALFIDTTNESWMSSLPEISTLDYSPQSTAAALTFGPHSGKKAKTELAEMGNDNAAADVNDSPELPPYSQ